MARLRIQTAAEQVASHLREELCRGVWHGRMPGGAWLSRELGVGRDTVEAALQLLEREGWLVPQGAGRRRRVDLPEGRVVSRSLRVAILDLDPAAVALAEGYMADLMHLLGEAGHHVFFADKSLQELRMDVRRVARLVGRTSADAWLIGAGSRDVLEWFAAGPLPAFALFGRRRGLSIAGAGPDMVTAYAAVARRLIELGHRRIVMLTRRQRRLPGPGAAERAVLAELDMHGIPTGAFNLPDWDDTREDFHRCLRSLFQTTPPTVLIINEAPFLVAALQFLGRMGIRVPDDVSLVCSDPDPAFAWCEPTVAHIRWDTRPVVRRVVQWVENVARGNNDQRQTLTKAEFIEGGTLGPAKLIPPR